MDIEALKTQIRKDWDFHNAWRSEARDNFAFLDGDQWDDEAKADMEEMNRAPIVFNRVAPIIHAIAGTEINNRTEVRYIPRTMGDAKVNEALTAGGEWFRDTAQAEEEDSQAFMDSLVCGIGVTDTTLDFETDEEGEPSVIRMDPTTAFWDRAAHRKCLKDAKRTGFVLFLPEAEAQERFPGVDIRDLNAAWLNADEDEDGDMRRNRIGDEYAGDDDDNSKRDGNVCIVQVQWCERERVVEYVEPTTGERKSMSPEQYDRLIQRNPLAGMVPHRKFNRMVWRQAFIGERLLGEITYPCREASTIKFITGNYNRKKRRFYGALEMMKFPQMFANKWVTQIQRIIDNNAKGGVMIESDAVSDIREFEENWAASDSVNILKPGGLGKIQEKTMPTFPAALMGLTEFAISSIRDVSGVNLEILGMREANQPGVLEYQRRQSAMTTLAGYFDALRQYRKEQGEVILYFLRKHIAPTGRLVRLMKDGEPTFEPLEISDDAVKYDVIVDDAPSAPNQKEKTWEVVQQLLPLLSQAGASPEIIVDALEHSPLPVAFIEKLRAELEKAQKAPPDPMQQQMVALEIADKQASIAEKQSSVTENEANAALDGVRAQEIAQSAALAVPRLQIEAAKAVPPIPQTGGFA